MKRAKTKKITISLLALFFLFPLAGLGAINIEGADLPLGQEGGVKINSDDVVSLWVRFNDLSSQLNLWLKDRAGVQVVEILKTIGNLFLIVLKWMASVLEYLLNRG